MLTKKRKSGKDLSLLQIQGPWQGILQQPGPSAQQSPGTYTFSKRAL